MANSTAPVEIFIVNEVTVWGLVWRCAIRRDTYVLDTVAIVPPLQRLIKRCTDFLCRYNNVRDARDLPGVDQFLWEYPTRVLLFDVFGKTEEWNNRYFGFDEIAFESKLDAMTFKKVTCNYMAPVHVRMLMILALLDSDIGSRIVFFGEDADARSLRNAYTDTSRDEVRALSVRTATIFCNTVLALALGLYGALWVLSRTRLDAPEPDVYFFAADYYSHPADFRLYREVAGGGPILLVARNDDQDITSEEIADYDLCRPTDGRLGLKDGLKLAAKTFASSIRQLMTHACLRPAHFYGLAALPYRSAVLAAFFNRFQPKFFWGRDDYNVEHMLRRNVLHKYGSLSLGIMHGFPAYSRTFPMWRYISFDKYYVHGPAIYERVMKDTWDEDMTVVSIGSFGAQRSDYATIDLDRPNDIVIYTAAFVGTDQMTKFVRELATEFPDRTVYLQLKARFTHEPFGLDFIAACTSGLNNVKITSLPLFELFRTARYGFSDPSTVVVEALQFGQIAFFTDIMPAQRNSIYRDFPDACVRSAKEAAEKIRAHENGEAPDIHKTLSDLVHFSNKPYFDVIREDLGLTAQHGTKREIAP